MILYKWIVEASVQILKTYYRCVQVGKHPSSAGMSFTNAFVMWCLRRNTVLLLIWYACSNRRHYHLQIGKCNVWLWVWHCQQLCLELWFTDIKSINVLVTLGWQGWVWGSGTLHKPECAPKEPRNSHGKQESFCGENGIRSYYGLKFMWTAFKNEKR